VGGGEVEPFGNGPLAWVGRWLGEDAFLEQALDDGGADAQEVDARVHQGVVEVKDDDARFGLVQGRSAYGNRVAPNQWLDQ
jgi:hypothetical protein